jgi:hypothetical protein
MKEPTKEELMERVADLERKQEQQVKDVDAPVYIRMKDGRLIQNGSLLDYPGRPVPRSLDRIMRFDMLRHTTSIHTAVREISKLKFSDEHKAGVQKILEQRHQGPKKKGQQ